MKRLLSLLGMLALALMPSLSFGQAVTGVFNAGATGTASATVFIKPSNEFLEITDLSWKLDAGVTTGIVVIRSGDVRYPVTSAGTGSGTVVFITNTGTAVAAGEYIIIYDDSAGDYYLRQVNSAAAISLGFTESLSITLTTSDVVWSVAGGTGYARAAMNASQTSGLVNIWLPKDRPTAVTIDGNTTACRISVSGVRGDVK